MIWFFVLPVLVALLFGMARWAYVKERDYGGDYSPLIAGGSVLGGVIGFVFLIMIAATTESRLWSQPARIAEIEAERETLQHERYVNEDLERFAIYTEIQKTNKEIAKSKALNKTWMWDWFYSDLWDSVEPIRVPKNGEKVCELKKE